MPGAALHAASAASLHQPRSRGEPRPLLPASAAQPCTPPRTRAPAVGLAPRVQGAGEPVGAGQLLPGDARIGGRHGRQVVLSRVLLRAVVAPPQLRPNVDASAQDVAAAAQRDAAHEACGLTGGEGAAVAGVCNHVCQPCTRAGRIRRVPASAWGCKGARGQDGSGAWAKGRKAAAKQQRRAT